MDKFLFNSDINDKNYIIIIERLSNFDNFLFNFKDF
jgi:hypothetical protein